MRSGLRAAALALAVVLLAGRALATWSIAAVDPASRQVGAAGATCTVGIEYIQGLVPGRGVILAQASTNWSARDRGVDLLRIGTAPAEVLGAIANDEYDPPRPWGSYRERQYGVAALEPEPATASFTGDETGEWAGARSDANVTVQGNILVGPEVIDAAFEAFHGEARRADGCAPDLGERLLRALEAGAAAGGDRRCSRQRAALSAFVSVARPEDERPSPWLGEIAPRSFGPVRVAWHLLFPFEPPEDDPTAVALLRERYEQWRRRHRGELPRCSSR